MKQALFLSLLFTLSLLSSGFAQTATDFDLTWATIGNGGGTSRSDDFQLQDNIGQSGGAFSQSDPYALRAGYLTGVTTVPYLVLLYVNGDNDLWPYMTDLVKNVQNGAAQSQAVVLMMLDGPGSNDSYLYRLEKGDVGLCNLQTNPTCDGRYLPGHNHQNFSEDTADPAELANFFTQAIQQYSGAQRIIAAIVGHGGGWAPDVLAGQPPRIGGQPGGYGELTELGGLLWDSHTNDPARGSTLSTSELGVALHQVHEKTKRKIDLLYLDACLMGMWEVAYEVRTSVDYLLVSESWSWTTFTYDEHLRTLQSNLSIPAIAAAWIQNEVNELCPDNRCAQSPPYTYSLIDLNASDAFTPTLNLLADTLQAALPSQRLQISQAFSATLQSGCFDSNQDYRIDELDTYCDLYSFADHIQKYVTDQAVVAAADAVKKMIVEQLVVDEQHRSGILPAQYPANYWLFGDNVKGLSIYLPLNPGAVQTHPEARYGWKLKRYNEIQASKTGWDEFLNAYWAGTPIPAQECSGACDLPGGPIDAKVRQFLPLIQR